MRVCFVEDTKLHGGTQLWVREAINYFIEQNVQVSVITPENGWLAGECAKSTKDINCRTYSFNGMVSDPDAYYHTWVEALKEADIAICTVHPPRGDFHCVIFATKCISENRLKTILIAKTGTVVPSYKREYYIAGENVNARIVAIARYTKEYLINNYRLPEEKIQLIYQGIDTERFSPSSSKKALSIEKWSLEGCKPVIGCIGYFLKRKGHEILLEAVSRLIKGIPSVHLLLVGDGPEENNIRKSIKERGLEDIVTIVPFTNEPELVHARIDLLILPSTEKEGLPNVVLESLAMETPVIATAIGGMAEIIQNGENGYLVEPEDAEQLVIAVKMAWLNEDRYNRLVSNCREKIVSKFSREKQFTEFYGYFKALLGTS
ncbi:MAG: glycosyltransferase family 4 protein [Candidatus Hodarchaeales archaeon]